MRKSYCYRHEGTDLSAKGSEHKEISFFKKRNKELVFESTATQSLEQTISEIAVDCSLRTDNLLHSTTVFSIGGLHTFGGRTGFSQTVIQSQSLWKRFANTLGSWRLFHSSHITRIRKALFLQFLPQPGTHHLKLYDRLLHLPTLLSKSTIKNTVSPEVIKIVDAELLEP